MLLLKPSDGAQPLTQARLGWRVQRCLVVSIGGYVPEVCDEHTFYRAKMCDTTHIPRAYA